MVAAGIDRRADDASCLGLSFAEQAEPDGVAAAQRSGVQQGRESLGHLAAARMAS